MNHRPCRRDFLKTGAALAVLSAPGPISASLNSKLRTAHIGVGGMGASDLKQVSSHPQVEVAALCDVDAERLGQAHSLHPHAKTFQDFREMLSSLGDSLDAVVVSTPDHTHAPAAMTALNLSKPVYCQKPLTHDVFEARQLRLVAEQKRVPTQMGIQRHSSAPYLRAVTMIRSGVIGRVSRVYAWSGKNWGYDGEAFQGSHAVPDRLNWDLWLGTASDRAFQTDRYHPANWRKLIDFGTGTLGDMGVHIFDTPYAALELTMPLWARTTCREPTGIGHPERNVVEYEFPGTPYTSDTLLWTWYDGQGAADNIRHPLLPSDFQVPDQGSLFVGQDGIMLLPHVAEAELFPRVRFRDYHRPEVVECNHYHQWVDACLGDGSTSTSFSYGGPLTEALLLGVVANRFPGTKLTWSGDQLKVTDVVAANALLRRNYRQGFAVAGLS